MPALRRTTGSSPGRRVKLPRTALAYSTSPTCSSSSMYATAEQWTERAAPTGAQRGDSQRPLQFVARMTGHVQQRIDLEYGHALGARRDLHDLVAGLYLALFQDAEIEPGSTVGDQQRRHPRLV